MKKYSKILIAIFLALIIKTSEAEVISGNIKEDVQAIQKNQVVDMKTGLGVDRAKISLPQKNYSTFSDQNGFFDLDPKINKKTILSVEKHVFAHSQ